MAPMIPRPEHPRPHFRRKNWLNLNGTWTFEFDNQRSGIERGVASSTGFDQTIHVPFCPESELSGVGYKDFIECMWYHREITIPQEWAGTRVLLHFGAVDWECEAYVDGASVGVHYGGSSSFSFDITRFVQSGSSHHLVVRVVDRLRSGVQGVGKQSPRFESYQCRYTRVTGIWQTVWLESVGHSYLERVSFTNDITTGRVVMTPWFAGANADLVLKVDMWAPDGTRVAHAEHPGATGRPLVWQVENPELWCPENPNLYSVQLTVLNADGEIQEVVESYTAFRTVAVRGNRLFLNGRPLYLRQVLDQGYYPDGIWTAPSDAALRRDIELSMEAGFNGARLHQKVFEERFHYWADKLGYLTWGEFPSWGLDFGNQEACRGFANEWREIVLRDINHPSIITWTPLNETMHQRKQSGKQAHDRFLLDTYFQTRALDPSRPVHDTSGYVHVKTDIWSVHIYSQKAEDLKRHLIDSPEMYRQHADIEPSYEGQPYYVDEFGGTKWIREEDRSTIQSRDWGYGDDPQSIEECLERMEILVRTVNGAERIAGWCWTQLTDVEQERNGIYTYKREQKFPPERLKRVFGASDMK